MRFIITEDGTLRRSESRTAGNVWEIPQGTQEVTVPAGVRRIAHDEANGSDPDALGRKIARALQKKRLPRRLRVAKMDQHLAVVLHDVLKPFALPCHSADWTLMLSVSPKSPRAPSIETWIFGHESPAL